MIFVILTIGFLALMYFATSKNKNFFNKISGLDAAMNMGAGGGNTAGQMSADPTGDLARALDFTYTPIAKNVEKKDLKT